MIEWVLVVNFVINFLKTKKYYLLVLVVLAGVVVLRLGNGETKQRVTASVRNITEEVAATGTVKPEEEVNLGFSSSGKVASVNKKVGDSVLKGEIIASLDSKAEYADLLKARSLLDEEQAKLRESNTSDPSSYTNAYNNLNYEISSSFASADNAIRNRVDQFFKTPISDPRFEIKIENGSYIQYFDVPTDSMLEINSMRRQVETVLKNWQARDLSSGSKYDLLSETDTALKDLNTISRFLDKVASAVNTFTPSNFNYEVTVTGYKTSISSARNEVLASLSDLIIAKDKLNNAPVPGDGGQFESVTIQQAKVSQAKSAVALVEANIENKTLRAPFEGIITLQDIDLGASVGSGVDLVSIMSNDDAYIEANISEIHIGKIAETNTVTISFDAYANEEFEGTLLYIEPGSFLVDGVVNYKIKVGIDNFDQKIKSGLTSNLKIVTNQKEDVVSVPLYAVAREGNRSFVNRVLSDDKVEKVEVTLGIIGSDSFVEIVSGLNEGDVIEF